MKLILHTNCSVGIVSTRTGASKSSNTMNGFLISVFAVCVAMATAETYTDKYDNIDVDEILGNRKLLMAYIKCTLETGRCTPEGKELKLHLSDGMITGCSKCTNKQKHNARKIAKYMKANEQESWEQMKAKYDPENKHIDIYEAFLAEQD